MKYYPVTILLFTMLAIAPNVAFASLDYTTQIEKTIVRIQAQGSDTEWISSSNNDEAKELAKFVESFNDIAYREDLSSLEKENALTEAAQKAFDQRSKTFKGIYCVKFSPVIGSESPALSMFIYPQTQFGYNFEISFTPQSG